MPNEQDLYVLVTSTHRKSLPAKTKNKGYNTLYNWIKKQEKGYNRDEFGKRYKMDRKAVLDIENYLYHKLLELAVKEETKDSCTAYIDLEIMRARTLEQKGLYDRAFNHLEKAAKKARSCHKYYILMDIIPRKINVLLYARSEKRQNTIDEAYAELGHITRIIQEEARFRHQNAHWFILTEQVKHPNDIPELSEIEYREMLDRGFPQEGSFFSQYYYYSIQAIHDWCHKKKDTAIKAQRQVVALWDDPQFDNIKSENMQLYLTQLANLALYLNSNGQHNEMKEVIQQMERLHLQKYDEETEQLQNVLYLKQMYYLNTLQFAKAANMVDDIKRALEEHEYKINPRRKDSFKHNIISFLFAEQYNRLSEHLEDYSSLHQKSPYKITHRQFIRIMQMIGYYTLGSNKFLQNILDHSRKESAKAPSERVDDNIRKVKRDKSVLTNFEHMLVGFFTHIQKTPPHDKRDILRQFKQLHKDLLALPAQDCSMGYGETVYWAEKMIHKYEEKLGNAPSN